MPRLVKQRQHYYTNVSNQMSRDTRISYKARGLFTYMWGQADNWQFYVSELVKHSDKDGRDAVQTGLDELEQYGYLKRVDRRKADGSFDGKDWILTDEPETEPIKNAEKPSNGKPVGREIGRTENPSLRNNNNKNYQNKELTTTPSYSPSSKKSDSSSKQQNLVEEEKIKIIEKQLVSYQDINECKLEPADERTLMNMIAQLPKDDVIQKLREIAILPDSVNDPVSYLFGCIKKLKVGDSNGS